MSGLFGKIHNKQCCCAGCIGGCCWPRDFSDPLYPLGTFKDLCWVIDAPNCAELDGKTGFFIPVSATAAAETGECGACYCYRNLSETLAVTGSFWSPTGGCTESPCSIGLCFFLSCDSNETGEEGVTECCKRFRLIVGTNVTGNNVSGWETVSDDDRCESLRSQSACAENLFGEVGPIACECADDNGGVTALFDLSAILLQCDGVIVGGDCDGKPNCCSLFACDLTDATLTVAPCP